MKADFSWLKQNLEIIETEIASACLHAGRSRSEVSLMAVSKFQPVSLIVAAAALGLSVFGESRVQEFQKKRSILFEPGESTSSGAPGPLPTRSVPLTTAFHFIGHLQSNKAARAVHLFSSVDTVDSLRLAERLNESAASLQRRLAVFVEIKLSSESSKTGLAPNSHELDELLERLADLKWLDARGLMTIPPFEPDPEASRPYFARLRSLREQIHGSHPRLNLQELSMGMSHDFSVAIEEGSTQVRIGTKLFGPRPPTASLASH